MICPGKPNEAPYRFNLALVLVGFLLLGGCAANGDLGEVRPYLVNDSAHDWVGNDAIAGQPTSTSTFNLTDDERAMRDLGYPLIEPAYDRHQWYAIGGEYGLIGSDHRAIFDKTAYINRLQGDRYRSPSARYNQLIDDIRNDTTRLPQFFETAGRVMSIDDKRWRSFAYIRDITPYEREQAMRRMRENASILGLVRARLDQRVISYRFALERLVIMTPTNQAVEAERALNQLQTQIARYRRQLPPVWTREQSLASSQ